MAIGWGVMGVLGVLAGIGRSTFSLISGGGFLALALSQVVAGFRLRRAEES